MANIARRSVAPHPSSLTSTTIPSRSFIEHNFQHSISSHHQKQKRFADSEAGSGDTLSLTTTTLPYSASPTQLTSESLDTSSTQSASSFSSAATLPAEEIETSAARETPLTANLPKQTIQSDSEAPIIPNTATATTISNSVDPLRSTDYQLTTRTIPKKLFDSITTHNINIVSSNSSKHHHHGGTTSHTHKSPPNSNSNNVKSVSNVNGSTVLQNGSTKNVSVTSTASEQQQQTATNTILPTTAYNFSSERKSPITTTEMTPTTMSPEMVAADRERIRVEFYATYDVMTGVRIAATLGGFFSLMVFLIVWKSRSHSSETIKALKDPKTAALTVQCMQEEEDRKIIEAMDATGLSIFPDEYDTMMYRRQRMLSVGNVSAPPVLNRGFRFSSVGGYSSLLEPPRRFSISSASGSVRRRSASESSRILSNFPMGSSFGTDDYFIETDDELEGEYDHLNQTEQRLLHKQGFLEVPSSAHQDTRRSSAMTCCSTESSYLERRSSALTLGINNLPPALRQREQPPKKTRRGSSTENWDYYYPDIQVIQATPKTSPLTSDNNFERGAAYKQARTVSQDTTTTAASGFSSVTLDSSGSSWQRNSMTCFYDPESLQDRRLPSIDSEHSLDFRQSHTTDGEDDSSDKLGSRNTRRSKHVVLRQPTIITTTSATPSPQSLTDKFDDLQELKLRKYSDASSCINNNTSFSYYVSNSSNNNASTYQNKSNRMFDSTLSCMTDGITQPQSSTYSVSRAVRSNLRGVGTIGGTGIGRAPLASCSSFKMSSVECQDSDLISSLGDDESVFIESYADTDDDLEQFSTDSDEISLDIGKPIHKTNTIKYEDDHSIMPTLPINNQQNLLQQQQHKMLPSSTYEQASFYDQQISTTSAPLDVQVEKKPEETRKFVGKGAILKQRASMDSHKTLSVSSSDKVLLVSKSKRSTDDVCGGGGTGEAGAGGVRDPNMARKIRKQHSIDSHYNTSAQKYISTNRHSLSEQQFRAQFQQKQQQQEELLLKPILSPSNTPLLAIRRSHLQQQFSDASHSLPTTDETTTTLDTCSTEIPVVTTIVTTNLTGTATTTSIFSPSASAASNIDVQVPKLIKRYHQPQHIQKPPITIKKQSSFSYDNNDSSISSNSNSNSINRNLNKKHLNSSSSRGTSKKSRVKNRATLSDSSVPPQQQKQLQPQKQSIVALDKSSFTSSSTASKHKTASHSLEASSSSKAIETEMKTFLDNITDNYTKVPSDHQQYHQHHYPQQHHPTKMRQIMQTSEIIDIPDEQMSHRHPERQLGLFQGSSNNYSSSSSKDANTDDCEADFIDSGTEATTTTTTALIHQTNVQKNIVDKNYCSNLLDTHSGSNLSSSSSSTNNFSHTSKTNNSKQIVDVVSIIIEGDDSNRQNDEDKEDNSTKTLSVDANNINIENANAIIVTNTNSSNKKLFLDNNSKNMTSTSVMLELPVIRVPTDIDDNDDDDSLSSRSGIDTNTDEFFRVASSGRARSKSEHCDPPIRDPSLPRSSRKWSKETLF